MKLKVYYDRQATNPMEYRDVEIHKQRDKPETEGKAFPLYKYEHGRVYYSTEPFSSRWDSGRVGWISTKALTKEKVEHLLQYYNDWVNGEVFAMNLIEEEECECCGQTKENCVDSIAGMYTQEFLTGAVEIFGVDIEDIDSVEKEWKM